MPPSRLKPLRRLAGIGLGVLCGCQPAPPIKGAFIGGLSGRVSALAIDERNGVQLAVETLNGRSGPPYELRVHDDAQSIDQAPAVIAAVAAEGDAFAVGPMTSAFAERRTPEAAKRRLVLISPTANSDELGGIDDSFFRVIPPSGSDAVQIADAAISRGLSSAAVMGEWRKRRYGESFASIFSVRFQKQGGTPAHLVTDETDQPPDNAKIAIDVLSTHPRLVLLVCSAIVASIVAPQLRRRDPDVPLAMASSAADVQLLQMGGRPVEGAPGPQALDLDSQEPADVDFRECYVERSGGPPSQAAVFSHDATMMGAEGLSRKTERQSLRAPGSWPGLQQPVVLDHFGDSINRFQLSEVLNRRFVMLATRA